MADPRQGPLDQILGCLDAPLLVIDDAFHILNANPQAIELLGWREGASDFGRCIVGETSARSLHMRRQIRDAMQGGGRTMLMLIHPRHKHLICSIKGVRRDGADFAHALVAITPLKQALANVAPFLRDIYKLSQAEAEIAVAASAGQEVSQIVLARKVSIHTLRAQIASIKAKMGLNRMTEVAVVVARIQTAVALL
jgi:DNA-binding CsgD family transcriptional regulator